LGKKKPLSIATSGGGELKILLFEADAALGRLLRCDVLGLNAGLLGALDGAFGFHMTFVMRVSDGVRLCSPTAGPYRATKLKQGECRVIAQFCHREVSEFRSWVGQKKTPPSIATSGGEHRNFALVAAHFQAALRGLLRCDIFGLNAGLLGGAFCFHLAFVMRVSDGVRLCSPTARPYRATKLKQGETTVVVHFGSSSRGRRRRRGAPARWITSAFAKATADTSSPA